MHTEMAEVSIINAHGFDDTKLRAELRQIVEAHGEELTADLGLVLN